MERRTENQNYLYATLQVLVFDIFLQSLSFSLSQFAFLSSDRAIRELTLKLFLLGHERENIISHFLKSFREDFFPSRSQIISGTPRLCVVINVNRVINWRPLFTAFPFEWAECSLFSKGKIFSTESGKYFSGRLVFWKLFDRKYDLYCGKIRRKAMQ